MKGVEPSGFDGESMMASAVRGEIRREIRPDDCIASRDRARSMTGRIPGAFRDEGRRGRRVERR